MSDQLKQGGKIMLKAGAMGCGGIIVLLALLVFITKIFSGGDDEVATKSNNSKEDPVSSIETMTPQERLKELALIFNYQKIGTTWSKENNFCSQDHAESKRSPWHNSYTLPSTDRYTCSLDIRKEGSREANVRSFLHRMLNYQYTFFKTTLNGVYINLSDKNGQFFTNKEEAILFLNQIYGEENIKQKTEGISYFASVLGMQPNNLPFIDIAYGCKAYNRDSPSSLIPLSNTEAIDKYKYIIKEVAPNDSKGDARDLVEFWEISTDEMKNIERCVVATVYEETSKPRNLGEEPDTAVTIGLMEVNVKFPDLFNLSE